MKKRKVILLNTMLILIIIFSFSVSSCNEEQIDINNANLEELEEIYGIGPAYGQRIIEYRENKFFQDVDELTNIKGIGDVTLGKIENQGLACVSTKNENGDDENNVEDNNISEGKTKYERKVINKPIKLNNPKDIKTPNINYKSVIEKHAISGLIIFGIFIVSLSILTYLNKKYKEKYKNEFR